MSSLLRIGRMVPTNTTKILTRSVMPSIVNATNTKRFISNFHNSIATNEQNEILQFRDKPESLSYFTGNFKYNDLLIELDALHKKFHDWKPTESLEGQVSTTDDLTTRATVYSWKLRDKMSESLSIPLTTSQWRKITSHLTALASLPKPLPASVATILKPYQRLDASQSNEAKLRSLDEFGRAYAVGRRKESSAVCYLVKGEGKVLVNGMELYEYFQRSVDQNEVTLPLDATELKSKFNAWVVVKGGGSTGQAQAIKLGLGRALLIHDHELKPVLRKAGCITRDPRVVERKKEGQRKARAKYTWVKR